MNGDEMSKEAPDKGGTTGGGKGAGARHHHHRTKHHHHYYYPASAAPPAAQGSSPEPRASHHTRASADPAKPSQAESCGHSRRAPADQSPGENKLLKGLLVGGGVGFLLTNETVQKGLIRTVVRMWSVAQGGIEEVKERFRDAEAEIRAAADKS
jgi:hypothetical protein